jgi:hypothetical protein
MLVAIALIPTASARLEFGGTGRPAGSDFRDAVVGRVETLISTPRRRTTTIATTVLLSLAVIFFLTPAAEYLPEGEEPKVFASMSAPPGYNLDTMAEIGLEIQERFLPYVNDDPERFERGETDVPALKYLNLSINAGRVRIISEPVDPDHIDEMMEAITAVYESYPGMRAFAARGSIITSNDGGTRSINLDISGPSLAVIYDVALATYRRAQEVFGNPRIQSSPSSLTLAQPLVEVQPNWDRASEVGMSAGDIGYTVAALTDGAFVDEFFLQDDKIDIYLFGSEGGAASLDTLATGQRSAAFGAGNYPRNGGHEFGAAYQRPAHRYPEHYPAVVGASRDGRRDRAQGRDRRVDIERCDAGGRHRVDFGRQRAGGDIPALGIPAADHDHDPARYRGRYRRPGADEWCRRRFAVNRPGRPSPALRYDLDAGLPDPDGDGGQQSHPDRGPGHAPHEEGR